MEDVCIIGAGGHGRVILDILNKMDNYQVMGFIDDVIQKGALIDGCEVLGNVQDLLRNRYSTKVIVGIGDNRTRKRVFLTLKGAGFEFVNAIHPSVIINSNVKIGSGNVFVAGVIVNPGTVIGDNVIINTSATIGHDLKIYDHVHISPGVNCCGHAVIGELTHLGAGTVVIPEKTIGAGCIIGAGTVVINDIPDNKVVVGVPGKIIKDLSRSF